MCSLQPILGDFEPGHGLQTQRPTAWSVHKGVEVRSGWQPFTNPKQTSVQCRFANYVFHVLPFVPILSVDLTSFPNATTSDSWLHGRGREAKVQLAPNPLSGQSSLRRLGVGEEQWPELWDDWSYAWGRLAMVFQKNGCPTFCKHTLLRWNHVIINPYRSFWDIDYIIMITVIITFKYTTKPPCCGKDQIVFLASDEKKQDSC